MLKGEAIEGDAQSGPALLQALDQADQQCFLVAQFATPGAPQPQHQQGRILACPLRLLRRPEGGEGRGARRIAHPHRAGMHAGALLQHLRRQPFHPRQLGQIEDGVAVLHHGQPLALLLGPIGQLQQRIQFVPEEMGEVAIAGAQHRRTAGEGVGGEGGCQRLRAGLLEAEAIAAGVGDQFERRPIAAAAKLQPVGARGGAAAHEAVHLSLDLQVEGDLVDDQLLVAPQAEGMDPGLKLLQR